MRSAEIIKLMMEASRARLLTKTRSEDPGAVVRSNPLGSNFIGMSRGALVFHTNAQTTSGKDHWVQHVKFEVPENIKDRGAMIASLQHSTIKVKCNCPAFKYWGQWYSGRQQHFAPR